MDKGSKREFVLEGLDCANCAAKIEAETKNLAGVTTASMNFIMKTLTIELENDSLIESTETKIKAIVKRHEPDVIVKEKADEKQEPQQEADWHKYLNAENITLAVGILIFATVSLFKLSYWVEFALYLISYVLIGGEILIKSARNISKGQIFDENFLMSLATICAFAIGEFPEGVAVMLFYRIGEFFEDMAVNRSRGSIKSLMAIKPDFANLKLGKEIKRVSPEDVKIGDTIIIKPGEKVPLDGIIIKGASTLDTSALTGESIWREVEPGSEVLSGFINKNGMLAVEVTRNFSESAVAKILDLIQNAAGKKSKTENFITKFAKYYTPIVVFAAVAIAIIPPLVIKDAVFSQWLYKALIFLVISCPCALVISIPLSFFGGIGGASKSGILIKGSNYLEALHSVDTVVFDKTGTLTKGIFKVTKISNAEGISEERLLEYAALAEAYSNHPIAASIMKEYAKDVDKEQLKNYEEIAGRGTRVQVGDMQILAGNARLMESEGIEYEASQQAGTVVHIAANKKYAGYLVIADEIKDDAAKAIKELKAMGVKKAVMLTGDNSFTAKEVGKQLGIDEVYSELLPHEKVEKLELIESKKTGTGKLIFVGDGINDAPVLARADIGVAMGALGSDAAIEAADVVLMTDEPSKLVAAIRIAKRTKKIVWQNIIFAIGVKIAVMILGAIGIATIWEAVFADVGVALIAVINSMRVMRIR